jgi:hypothetical protein
MRVLCTLCVLGGLRLSAVALDREAFTFTKYDLDARVEPEQQRLGVRGKISLRNDSDAPQKNLVLQISSSLNWSSIQFEGKAATFLSQTYTSDIDHTGALTEAIVTLPKPVAPKETIELEIGYEGVIPQDTTRLTRIGVPAEDAKHSDWDEIGRSSTAVRGIGYVTWYPIATEAASLSDSSSVSEAVGRWKQREAQAEMNIRFSHSGAESAELPVLLCNGRNQPGGYEQIRGAHLRDYEQTPAVYRIWSDCSFHSLRYLVPVFAIGNYALLDQLAVNIRYIPEHKSGADDYALAIEQVEPFVKRVLGNPRETEGVKAHAMEIYDPLASPFESGDMLFTPFTLKENSLLLSAIQQLTHIMFSSSRPWIFHGLSGFAQVAYLQEEEGREAAINYLQHHRSALAESDKQVADKGDRPKSHSLINSPDEFYVQTKAMNVWWMLRDMIGENALSAALHNYKADDDKAASYIQKLIEAQAHRDLEWFFDDWVYRDRELPDFHIASMYPRELLNGGYMITVTVENTGAAGAEVPVTLHMEHGEATQRLIVPGSSQASVRIQAASLPREITVNDGSVPENNTRNNTYRIESLEH